MRQRIPLGTKRTDIYCRAKETIEAGMVVRQIGHYRIRKMRSDKFPHLGVTTHGVAKGNGVWVRVWGPINVKTV